MKKLKEQELEDVLNARPALKQELEDRGATDVFRLNGPEADTGPESERAGKRILLLLARSASGQDYLIMSTKGKPDKVVTWLHSGEISSSAPDEGRYIVIDKSKVGRPRRELTEDERQQIKARREAGESVNEIAKKMHIGTRRVMVALKTVST